MPMPTSWSAQHYVTDEIMAALFDMRTFNYTLDEHMMSLIADFSRDEFF